MIRPSDQKKRNELVRKEITEIAEANGIKWAFIAGKLNMERSNFSNWRRGIFDFSIERLKEVERFMEKYKNI